MDILIVIPARSGSKRIKNKNLKELSGKHLINYTIECARELFQDYQICVSTDSVEIINLAKKIGLDVPFIRPDHLATDNAKTIDVILHAIEHYQGKGYSPKYILLLQPTSPLRSSTHIKEAISIMEDEYDAVFSVKKTKSNPYTVLFEENSFGELERSKIKDFSNFNESKIIWELNGAIYFVKVSSLLKERSFDNLRFKKYVMDEKSSIDIDTDLDWLIAQYLINYEIDRKFI